MRRRFGRWIVPDTQVAEAKGCILHSAFFLLLPLLPSPPRFRRSPLHLCDLSKTTTRSAPRGPLPAQVASGEPEGSLRVASGWLRGAYRLATRWPEGGLGVAVTRLG